MTGIWEDQSKQGEQLFPEKGYIHWSNRYPLKKKKRKKIRVIETKTKTSTLDYNTIQSHMWSYIWNISYIKLFLMSYVIAHTLKSYDDNSLQVFHFKRNERQ